jgi:hypothetical protein
VPPGSAFDPRRSGAGLAPSSHAVAPRPISAEPTVGSRCTRGKLKSTPFRTLGGRPETLALPDAFEPKRVTLWSFRAPLREFFAIAHRRSETGMRQRHTVGRDVSENGHTMKATSKNISKTQRNAIPPEVTYVEDRGAVYDAPLEVVWDFMNDETFHPKAHTAAVRDFEERPLSEVTTLLSYERRNGNRWQKMVCRMTTIRPAVRIQEDLDGPFAGSKTVFLYTSQGERTIVDVFGYVRSSEMSSAEIKRERRKTWANAYSEDLPFFRRFAKQHPSVQVRGK